MEQATKRNTTQLLKTLGPGLIFAGSAIGTSHLVLSTRAGAHHGMIYFWIILIAMILKYPFFEFGPRYACATGYSLVKGYRDQGKWAVYLFMTIIFIDMFAVVAAVGAVSAGLLSTMFGVKMVSVPVLSGILLAITAAILLLGGYNGLDRLIKLISIVLFVAIFIAFGAVLMKGPVTPAADFQAPPLLEGAGLTLFISLLGWMPSGMESSTMNSIWSIEKIKATGYHPKLREGLFDFNLGYGFTLVLALMFLIIGAYSVYGTGQVLGGSSTQFSNQLLAIFTNNLGEWTYYVIAIAAFGTIYGTLIAVLDAFPRSFIRGARMVAFETIEQNETQQAFLDRYYPPAVIIMAIGGFALFYFSAASMIAILEVVTILSFLISPILSFLNLRAIQSPAVSAEFRPSKGLLILSYMGLAAMIAFSGYFLIMWFSGAAIH